jgi:hypothetical protein
VSVLESEQFLAEFGQFGGFGMLFSSLLSNLAKPIAHIAEAVGYKSLRVSTGSSRR